MLSTCLALFRKLQEAESEITKLTSKLEHMQSIAHSKRMSMLTDLLASVKLQRNRVQGLRQQIGSIVGDFFN